MKAIWTKKTRDVKKYLNVLHFCLLMRDIFIPECTVKVQVGKITHYSTVKYFGENKPNIIAYFIVVPISNSNLQNENMQHFIGLSVFRESE